jgi:membrane associated rhomboid family serine protease
VSENKETGLIDRIVDLLARAMDALGLNGTRLRWKWNRKRMQLAESGVRTEIFWRSARGKHKMCPGCRALVPRSARNCPECGRGLASVSAPGIGRVLANVLPGATAATSLILLVNGFWFVLMIMAQIKGSVGSGEGVSLFGSFDGELLVRFGSGLSVPVALPDGSVTGGEWWRIVTPIFLHAGLLHFFFNSYVILQLGPMVEGIFGTARFWTVYLSCGIAGSMASQLPREVNTIGASGAAMGLIGLLLVYGWRHGGALGESLKASMIRFLIYIAVFSLVFPGIDHFNHAGGFACGALLALVVPTGEYRGRGEAAFWQAASLAGVLVVLWAFYNVAASGMG